MANSAGHAAPENYEQAGARQLYPALIQLQEEGNAQRYPPAHTSADESITRLWKLAVAETATQCTRCLMPGGSLIGFSTGVLVFLTVPRTNRADVGNLLPFLVITLGCTLVGHLAGRWLPVSVLTFTGICTIARMRQ